MNKLENKLFQKFENNEIDALENALGGQLSGFPTRITNPTYVTVNTDNAVTYDDGDGHSRTWGLDIRRAVSKSSSSFSSSLSFSL